MEDKLAADPGMGVGVIATAGEDGRQQLPATAPRHVPARMVNEALYCERLCYLEWSQGLFEDNAFTVEG